MVVYCFKFKHFWHLLYFWMDKKWRFFREKGQLNILPAFRAQYFIFYIHGLFNRINNLLQSNKIENLTISLWAWSAILFYTFSLLGLISDFSIQLLGYLFLITFCCCLIPSLIQLNSFWKKEAPVFSKRKLRKIEIAALIWGSLFYGLLLLSLFLTNA